MRAHVFFSVVWHGPKQLLRGRVLQFLQLGSRGANNARARVVVLCGRVKSRFSLAGSSKFLQLSSGIAEKSTHLVFLLCVHSNKNRIAIAMSVRMLVLMLV